MDKEAIAALDHEIWRLGQGGQKMNNETFQYLVLQMLRELIKSNDEVEEPIR